MRREDRHIGDGKRKSELMSSFSRGIKKRCCQVECDRGVNSKIHYHDNVYEYRLINAWNIEQSCSDD